MPNLAINQASNDKVAILCITLLFCALYYMKLNALRQSLLIYSNVIDFNYRVDIKG